MGEQTPEVVAGRLSSGALADFIEELRELGYKIGLSQFIAAQDLVLALIGEGEALDQPAQ